MIYFKHNSNDLPDKAYDMLDRIADLAVEVHGGMGYSRELPVERFYRDSRINKIFEGTNEIQKGIIAHDILKKNGKIVL